MTFEMKRRPKELEGGSIILGELPRGCRLCAKGSKMVLFVTGLCESSCYYCPLSHEKAGKDMVYADEMLVSNDEDVLYELATIDAEGAGMSGGDPLCTLDKTVHFISLLKARAGKDFHLHLYTSKADARFDELEQLRKAGLDEIRFHPQGDDWSGIAHALSLGMTVGLEVPALPNGFKRIVKMAERAEAMGVAFLNLNELESSETNFEQLVSMGMRLNNLGGASIRGSSETAKQVIEWAKVNLRSLTVHYCSARFKDAVQLRNRLERRRNNVIRPFEEPDEEEPLLILGIIRAPHGQTLSEEHLSFLETKLATIFDVPSELMNVDITRNRIEIAHWILTEIAEDVKRLFTFHQAIEMGIAFEYPTSDRLQVLFEPLLFNHST